MLNEFISLMGFYQFNWTWPSLTMGTTAALLLLLAFSLFVGAEKFVPRTVISKTSLKQSFSANLSLFIFNSLVMSFLSASTLWMVAKQHYNQGLLNFIPNPVLKVVIALLSLDFLLYVWHRACHRYDRLWMFHKVHHNDPYLNVSTGFRVHITEMFTTYILKGILIISLGIDEFIVLIHEVATTLFVMFHHTNHSFRGERWLGYLITTPRLHRTHHSVERIEHDSNYGAVLSIWDRLLRTFSEKEPVEIGIKGYSPVDFINLVKVGFCSKLPSAPLPANLDVMIAEAAYYKAEKRNFMPGQEWNDWLEAKREIIRMVNRN
jgi:sterol desaturase/sphingolipid hydroxylase (fatty acid hydroxylase superfamily)